MVEFHTLPVQLSDTEIAERSNELACSVRAREQLRAEKLAAMEVFKNKLQLIDGSIAKLATAVRDHRESRSVACRWEHDDERLTMVLVRDDTGEIVETRPMEDSERQRRLPNVPEFIPADGTAPAQPDTDA